LEIFGKEKRKFYFCNQTNQKLIIMKCVNCGAEIANGAQFCHVCGSQQVVAPYQGQNNFQGQNVYGGQNPYGPQGYQGVDMKDAAVWIKIVSLLFPIVGIIYYFVQKKTRPVAAKSAITFAAIGFVINLVLMMFQ